MVGGQSPYPLRQCQFGFTQATDQRGRAAAKVRHGLLHLTLDVPTDDQLLDWANTVHKPLSGHITFFEDDRRTARETMRFAAGQCVSYQESFVAGDAEVGAYVCQLLITSDGLTLAPGGAPQAFVAPAARDYVTAATPAPPVPVAASPPTHRHYELTNGSCPQVLFVGHARATLNCQGFTRQLLIGPVENDAGTHFFMGHWPNCAPHRWSVCRGVVRASRCAPWPAQTLAWLAAKGYKPTTHASAGSARPIKII
jgi:hypothetical protein